MFSLLNFIIILIRLHSTQQFADHLYWKKHRFKALKIHLDVKQINKKNVYHPWVCLQTLRRV